MFKIIKDDAVIACVAEPIWIRMGDNGSFMLCEEHEAQGIALNGKAYSLGGLDADLISLEKTDVDAYISELTEKLEKYRSCIEYLGAIIGVDMQDRLK